MNITYTGKHGDLPADQQRKLDAKLAKLSKMIDHPKGDDKQAHVAINTERHLTNARLTVNYYDKQVVGFGSGADVFTAVTIAVDKVEEKLHDLREKWRDTRREPKDQTIAGAALAEAAMPAPAEAVEDDEAPKVFRVDHHDRRKPMTLDEAMIAVEGRDYVVYRDAQKDCVSVLIRRADGSFDLIEG